MTIDPLSESSSAVEATSEPSPGERFFENTERGWDILSILVAIVLFTQWALRSGLSNELIIISCSAYAVSVLVTTQITLKSIIIKPSDNALQFTYIRSAVSWHLVANALLGSALCFLLLWFPFASNSLTDPIFGHIVMLLAMSLTLLILPLAQLIASIPMLPIMKTRVKATVHDGVLVPESFSLDISPLDSHWYKFRSREDLVSSIQGVIVRLVVEHEKCSVIQ